jgi:hypothetical protein
MLHLILHDLIHVFSPLESSLLEDYGLWNFKGLD